MKRKFTFLLSAAIMLLSLIVQPKIAVGQEKGTGSYTITFGNNANSATGISSSTNASTVISNGTTYVTSQPFTINSGNSYYGDTKDCIRIGKQSNSASLTIALSNTGKVKATSIVVNCKLYNSSDASTLTVNSLTGQSVPSSAGNVTFTYNSATDIESITLAVTKKIFVYSITVNYTTGGGGTTPSNLALTGAPIALTFDLYNNSTPQVINYTTSSTGAVTIADNQYFTKVIDSENKTITITPVKVTPSAQTITVNQAADATYAACSVTFTVSISDSSPTPVWALTDIEDLTTSDIFVIVGRYNSTNYSMTNNGGTTRPTASSITISNNMIDNSNVANNIKWNISGNETNGYVFYPNGSTTTWLYNTDNNDGVKVGTGTTKAYTYNGGYLSIKTGTTNTRYLSYYSNQWRSYTNTNTAFTVTFYKRAYPSSIATPTFSKGTGTYNGTQNVTIECETDNVTIYYTLDGSDPTDSENEGRETYTSQLSISTSTTLKAAAYNNSEYSWIAKAKYNIVTPLTTMQAIFDRATAVGTTPTTVYITFNDWVVSGVGGTNNTSAYLTDGTKGCVIYGASHGFSEGDVLSGIAQCKVELNNGAARITELTSSTTGLDVDDGGTVTPQTTTIAGLSGVNTGAVYTLRDLTYSSTNDMLSDGTNTIKLFNRFYDFSDDVENGNKYHITGVFIYYNEKEIAPRDENDIVLAANISDTDFSGLTTFTYVVDNGPSDEQSFDMIGENFVEELTVTASGDYEVSNDNTSYDESTTFTPDEGIILDQTLYVRLRADLGTGPHNGTLTFTSENMTTIVLNLEGTVSESQTYAISLVQTTGGTIAADMSVASEGTPVTLSYSDLDDCYDFTRWTVYRTGDQSTTEDVDENGQFEMPGYPVTATATFTQKTFAISYSVNGTVESLLAANVTCGNNAPLHSASDLNGKVTLPTGYTLAGWSTSANSTETVSSFAPSENATLYAVLVPSVTGYQLITSASQITAGKYLFAALRATELPENIEYSIATGGISSGDMVVTSDKYAPNSNNIFTTLPSGGVEFELSGNNSDGFTIYYDSKYLGYTSATTSRTLAFNTGYSTYLWKFYAHDNGLSTGALYMQNYQNKKYYTVSENSTATGAIRGYAGETKYRGFYLFKKIEVTPYTHVYTGNNNATDNITISGPTLITSTSVLNMGSHTLSIAQGGSLIIEDGGQLIVPNNATPVSATVQKTIVAPAGTWGQNDNSGWYAISSTVGSIANNSLSSVTNLVPAPVNQVTQFDLYKYVEGSGWLNYAAHTQDFGGLANGHGYLYANKNGATLSFAGNITTSDVVLSNLSATSSNNNLKGIHLIGNPYTHNIYKSVAIEASEGTLSTGYYKLDGSNLWVAESDATPIAPGQGFLVKVTDGTTLTLHNTANSTRANNDYIRFAVANSQYEDATFAMFKEGKGLTKINHRNAEAPMIYINQDNANYAIATMSDATESFSLNFKAMTTGQYTLSFTTQGEFNYLHVIDRLTGADIDMLLEGEYKFIGTPNDSDNRFIVRLAYLPDYGEENGIFAYQSGNEIFVSGEGELQIFDVTGRYVMSERINGVNTINADALSKGVYVLRIIGSEIKTQKIVVR